MQRHALPEGRAANDDDTGRVRKFILKGRGEFQTVGNPTLGTPNQPWEN